MDGNFSLNSAESFITNKYVAMHLHSLIVRQQPHQSDVNQGLESAVQLMTLHNAVTWHWRHRRLEANFRAVVRNCRALFREPLPRSNPSSNINYILPY